MSTLTGLISGGGGGGNYGVLAFTDSTTFTPTRTVDALVFVIGAGGSGSGANQRSGTNELNTVGGGAGGCAVSQLSLVSGTAYTITIGAGGARKFTNLGSPSFLAGDDGGASSFSGSGISTMTANGGKGGLVSATAQAAVIASAGGTATGGNIVNSTGGEAAAAPSGVYYTSGGGSVGVWEDGKNSESLFLGAASTSFVETPKFTIANPFDFQVTSPQDARTFIPEIGASGFDYASFGSDTYTLGNSGALAGGLGGLFRDTFDGFSASAGIYAGDGGIGAGGGGALGYGRSWSGAGGNGIVLIKILDVL
jgi:hypothetical protein